MAIAARVATLALAMCGVMSALGSA